jgi:hypothetical protein
VRCYACGAIRPELTDEAIAEGMVIERYPPSYMPPSPPRPTIEDEYNPFSPEWMTR